jgi:8-oxo-dGTP pyrophosphatase MutT (NUDIX family)
VLIDRLNRLRANLSERTPSNPDGLQLEATRSGTRPSAVLVLLYPRGGEPHLVLTRRTPHLAQHSGQISLPGGRIDPLDFSAAEAALRETREELGVATDDLELLGPLMARYDPPEPYYVQASNSIVVPFVAFSPSKLTFVPNPAEVAEVIELPLRHLLEVSSVDEENWLLRGEWRRIGFYRFGPYKIWGATARILRQVVELAGGPPPPADLVLPGEVEPEPFGAAPGPRTRQPGR